MRIYIFVTLILLLSGCANGIPTLATGLSNEIKEQNEKMFIGVPSLLSLEGSTVRLDDNWVLTSKHNDMILDATHIEAHYHPECDIAIFKEQGESNTQVGVVYEGEQVTHVGYPINFPLAANTGHYLGEVIVDNWADCSMSATTGVLMSGMSGGGVYNQHGELVGINHGFVSGTVEWEHMEAEDPAVFLSLLKVQDWLYQITGQDFFSETSYARK